MFAQTYTLGPTAAPKKTPQSSTTAQQEQSLGWGSNIQNARLARGAQLALAKGDYAQALDYAQRAAQSSPGDPQLWFLLGYAARLNSRFAVAIDAYKRGLHLNPSSLEGLSGLAQTYGQMGRINDAEALLKQVLAADPRQKDDALLLGDLYMRGGDYTTALQPLTQAEHDQPSARAELLMALCYQHLNQMDLASRYLDMAKHRDPNNPDVQRSLAGYYREVGKYADAIAELKAIKNPRPDVVAELAFTYQLNGNLNDSAQLYARAANAVPRDLGLQLSAAQAQVAAGRVDDADPFLTRAQSLNANFYRLHAIRGEIAQLEGHEDQAVAEYREAIAQLPADAAEGPLYGIQLHMDLVELYGGLNDTASAHQQLAIAQTQIGQLNIQGSARPQFLRLRAMIRMNAGELESALADMKEAIALDPHDPNNLQVDGDVLMKMGRVEDAIAVYRRVLDIDPNNRFALTSLGYASRAAGRDQDAEKYFLRLAKADPTLYVPYLALGDLYTSKHEFRRAEEAYAKGYKLAPKDPLIVAGGMNAGIESHDFQLAGLWLKRVTPEMGHEPHVLREEERYYSFQGDYARSASLGEQAIKLLPKDRDVVVYLGYDLLRLERYDELLALTNKYENVFPKEPDVPLLAGYVEKHNGDDEAALADFSEALKRDPEVVTAYVNRGFVLNDLHRPADAAADFEAALKREPKNGEAHLGLAYASLDLHRPQVAVKQSELAEAALGDSKLVHTIRATAYGREGLLSKAIDEYRAALKFTPDDGTLYYGLGDTYFAERRYHEAIDNLQTAARLLPKDPQVDALMARSYANLDERQDAIKYVALAEQKAQTLPPPVPGTESTLSGIYVSTGEALDTIGEQHAAMQRFGKALVVPQANRVNVRLAIAQLMAQQGKSEDAGRQIALAQMESAAGQTEPVTGNQYIEAADIFRTMHEYQLSQNYLERAQAAGASDISVRIGMANNYLAVGDTPRAQSELAAVSNEADSADDYQYLLAQANVFNQQHRGAQALTAFAEATNAAGEDEGAQEGLLAAGANEGYRINPKLSVLSDFSVQPIYEDTTVYVLDSKLDANFAVPPSDTSLLPPPRSSVQTQWTGAFHLHLGNLPTPAGFIQYRNTQGQISVPATNSIVNRNTNDLIGNIGLNPTVRVGDNIVTFNAGIQATMRRDTQSPVQLNQNLLREFAYMSTSAFFDAVSVSGYVIHEAGPFTEINEHSSALTGTLDFRVGEPWGRTALVTGWGMNDQTFTPVRYENYYTSAYIGLEHRFGSRLDIRAVAEDLRAWRVVGANTGNAQDLRPAGTINFAASRNWDFQFDTAYSSTRSFHIYDATQNGFAVTYARPFRRKFNDATGTVELAYPIKFSAGLQQETFFNFTGGHNSMYRPYISITLF